MPVAKLSGMLLRPEAGTIISIFYYFDLFICIFQLQSGQLRSTLLVSVHPDKLWVYLFHYHTGHRQCFKYQLTRDLVFWLISRVQTDFSAGIVIIAACLCRWPFFQLHFLHLQFLLVQILCKDMFFNVLLGNVVCGCVCVLYTRHTFAIQDWLLLFQCCIFLGVFLWRCEMIISALTVPSRHHQGSHCMHLWPSIFAFKEKFHFQWERHWCVTPIPMTHASGIMYFNLMIISFYASIHPPIFLQHVSHKKYTLKVVLHEPKDLNAIIKWKNNSISLTITFNLLTFRFI